MSAIGHVGPLTGRLGTPRTIVLDRLADPDAYELSTLVMLLSASQPNGSYPPQRHNDPGPLRSLASRANIIDGLPSPTLVLRISFHLRLASSDSGMRSICRFLACPSLAMAVCDMGGNISPSSMEAFLSESYAAWPS